jgi:hypothetical protein
MSILTVTRPLFQEDLFPLLGFPHARLRTVGGQRLGRKLWIEEANSFQIFPIPDPTPITSNFISSMTGNFIVPLPDEESDRINDMTVANYSSFTILHSGGSGNWRSVVWNNHDIPTDLTIVYTSVAPFDQSNWNDVYAAFAEANDFYKVYRDQQLAFDIMPHTLTYIHKDNLPEDYVRDMFGFWVSPNLAREIFDFWIQRR